MAFRYSSIAGRVTDYQCNGKTNKEIMVLRETYGVVETCWSAWHLGDVEGVCPRTFAL